ncbi:mannose-6-phosphate isomerase, class I [Leekyejoonella antrihumi]|uniref:mannose-6-phosphate isomerase n=1 Tax=Leekyejoonella antrihumi TaxID=1660198 RepID=A0A563EAR3_9MICO|nr:mannose-6-phosphate isomerase, class I [Leekyejoonella antrihumi]TWP38884.1 mannose-6-phosphate isomerase, class I [Leekyejoonella antrihumi]
MHRLHPQVLHYAWGSHDVIAKLTGRPGPTTEPEAELWMGAHEKAPSGIDVDGQRTTLDELVESDPAAMLGDSCSAAFERRLPFLLKVLAPSRPLSIQCHPDAEQALNAPEGTYTDGWPKPEALIAVTEFEIFAGTRPFDEVRTMAERLNIADLTRRVESAATAGCPTRGLLSELLLLADEERIALVRKVVEGCRNLSDEECDGPAGVVARVSHLFPDDIGLVVLLLMRHRVLEPGSYVFVPAGVLHAYSGGTAVEILANSDNIVRAGLTPKKINISELLRIVDVDKTMGPAQPSVTGRARTYPTDAPHFQLHTISPGTEPQNVPGDGIPRIMLALHDSVTLETAVETLKLAGGESCFVPASEGPVTASGRGELFIATTGPRSHLDPAPTRRSSTHPR